MSDIVERAKAALKDTIPGPWEAVHASPTMNGIPTYQVRPTGRPGVVLGATADGESALFIAASRTLVPELVAEVERLTVELQKVYSAGYLAGCNDTAYGIAKCQS